MDVMLRTMGMVSGACMSAALVRNHSQNNKANLGSVYSTDTRRQVFNPFSTRRVRTVERISKRHWPDTNSYRVQWGLAS